MQFERAIRTDMCRRRLRELDGGMPVLMDINLIPTGAVCPTAGGVFNRGQRGDLRSAFDHVNVFKSIGGEVQRVHGGVRKRMTQGWQAQATYTLARGEDDAPLTSTYVVGSGDDRVSDPAPSSWWGVTPFNQAHTFAVSTIVAPVVAAEVPRRAGQQQCRVILQANSRLPFNIRSRTDLNRTASPASPRRRRAQRRPSRPRGLSRSALFAVRAVQRRAARRLFFEAKNLLTRRTCRQ